MAQVSKWPLGKDTYNEMYELLFKLVTKTNNRSEAARILDELLTPTEKIMLAKRLAVAVLLYKGFNYDTIKDILHVSGGTIADINSKLKYKKAILQFTDKVLKEEKVKRFWQKIGKEISKLIPERKGGGMYSGIAYMKEKAKEKARFAKMQNKI